MKKKLFLAAITLTALMGCTTDEFVGDQNLRETNQNGAISFNSGTPAITRADKTGSGAAEDLHNQFFVYGIKKESVDGAGNVQAGNLVFQNYVVKWSANSAMTTTSNTENWEYVGYTLTEKERAKVTTNSGAAAQTIKYWDWGAADYTFYAFSALPADIEGDKITVAKVQNQTTAASKTVYDNGYTVTLAAGASLDDLYFSERVNIVKSEGSNASNTNRQADNTYGGNVTFRFHNMATKVRVAMYETIPGYSVTIKEFKVTDAANPEFSAMETSKTANFAANLQNCTANTTGTMTITYDGTTGAASLNYPKVNFTGSKNNVLELGAGLKENVIIGTSAAEATYDQTGKAYTSAFPNEENSQNLKLKVSYTLTAPNTNEVITVTDATAEIPAKYLQWKPGFAYTYLFKINDNSNGSTGTTTDPAGLYPITFDAVEMVTADGSAEYITTVSEPSITTFGVKDGKYTTGKDEYEEGTDIYVTIVKNSAVVDPEFMSKTHLYKVTCANPSYVTEASVAEAYAEHPTGTPMITLTHICTPWKNNSNQACQVSGVPAEDGTTISNNKAVKFTPGTGDAGLYAVQYIDGSTISYVEVTVSDGASVEGLYLENGDAASGTAASGTKYYEKTVTGTPVYKIIKVVAP